MISHPNLSDSSLIKEIRNGSIRFGGNKQLKIYGALNCWSGKRMKRSNRVFFANEQEALESGYRPCAHCMKDKYLDWKNGLI